MSRATILTPVRAAIYCRISKDREGAGLGVERQEAECRVLAERLGWEVGGVYVDNDISAYSGRHRPGYRAMLDAVRAEQVTGVLAWHTDRLHRRNAELEPFIVLAETHDLRVQTVTTGDIDLTTPDGRMVARILGAAGQREVEQTRKRIRSQKAQAAAAGAYRGGMRPYGYEDDGVTVREAEAQVIRDSSTAILTGRTLAGVARELNDSGRQRVRLRKIKEGHGQVTDERQTQTTAWNATSLRQVLLRPRNAGLIHTGRSIEVDATTLDTKAAWDAIVPVDTWRAVHRLLTDSSRRTSQNTDTRWLGSGIYLCGVCGQALRVAASGETPSRPTRRFRHYRCASGHLTIAQVTADDHVRKRVATLLGDPRVVAAMTAPDPALDSYRDARTTISARLARIEADYDAEHLTGQEFRRKKDRALAELEVVEVAIDASVQRSASSPVLSALDPGARFLSAPLDIKRAVLRSLVRVRITPAKGCETTVDRVEITNLVQAG